MVHIHERYDVPVLIVIQSYADLFKTQLHIKLRCLVVYLVVHNNLQGLDKTILHQSQYITYSTFPRHGTEDELVRGISVIQGDLTNVSDSGKLGVIAYHFHELPLGFV